MVNQFPFIGTGGLSALEILRLEGHPEWKHVDIFQPAHLPESIIRLDGCIAKQHIRFYPGAKRETAIYIIKKQWLVSAPQEHKITKRKLSADIHTFEVIAGMEDIHRNSQSMIFILQQVGRDSKL